MNWRRTATTWLLIVPLFAGCIHNTMAPEEAVLPGETQEPALQDERLVIINDPAVLDARVRYTSRPLFIQMKETPGRELAPSLKPRGTELTLVGEVEPPTVDGLVVQANDIDIRGKRALVAYNFAGDLFAGAVQVIDFKHPDRPRLISEVLFRNADVNAVALQGSRVYVGLASSDPALKTPALMEELKLAGSGLHRTGRWVDLPSWAVTDLAACGKHIVAAVGARSGGVALVERDRPRLHVDAYAEQEDVRGIDFGGARSLVAVCGTRPRMGQLHLPDLSSKGMYEVDGYRNDAAKGTVEVHADLCYLGAGEGGFQVRRPDGELLAALRQSDFSNLRPDLMVTNAVSVHGHLAFVAAGALGVQVVDVSGAKRLAHGGDDGRGGALRVLGELGFEDGMSSNMVKSKNHVLVVAAGLGGVKLVKMGRMGDDDGDDDDGEADDDADGEDGGDDDSDDDDDDDSDDDDGTGTMR